MHPADHPIVSERYFFAHGDRCSDEFVVPVSVDGAELACARVDKGHPRTLLHFHGNGEIVSDYLPDFADLMGGLGLNSFFAEYRGYGGSTGTPKLASMLDDVTAIVEAAGGPEGLVVFGRSIGSIYAIEAAARFPAIAGLIIESGIADVLERILLRASPDELGVSIEDLRDAFAQRFDHQQKLASYGGRTLVLHAEHDHLVDVEHARTNARWAGDSCELVIFPRGDHNSIFYENRQAYLESMTRFVASL